MRFGPWVPWTFPGFVHHDAKAKGPLFFILKKTEAHSIQNGRSASSHSVTRINAQLDAIIRQKKNRMPLFFLLRVFLRNFFYLPWVFIVASYRHDQTSHHGFWLQRALSMVCREAFFKEIVTCSSLGISFFPFSLLRYSAIMVQGQARVSWR